MESYLELLRETYAHGTDQINVRTGKVCRILAGPTLRFDLAEGFPAVTTKKLAFKAVVGELLGFFRGYTSAADFRSLGCSVWDANANETPAWLANPNRKGVDDTGRTYGAQWTDWRDDRVAESPQARDALAGDGYEVVMHDAAKGWWLMRRGINQLEGALRMLLTNPSDRRIIVSAWRPDEMDRMALPSCHMDYRFVAMEADRSLHLVFTCRSTDLFLGAPFNIASAAVFLSVMARLAGFRPATLTMQMANTHIYEDHFDAAREQLTRKPLPRPTLGMSDAIAPITDLGQINGAFARIQPADLWLENYQSHPAIKAPMAV